MQAPQQIKGFSVIAVIIVIAIVLVGGYFLLKTPINVLKVTPTASQTIQTTPANWSTYQDKKGYFSIQYPSSLQTFPVDLDDRSHGVEIKDVGNPKVEVLINVRPDSTIPSLETYVVALSRQYEEDAQNSAAGANFTIEPITADGVGGYVLFSAESSAMGNVDVTYYFLKGGVLYTFNGHFDDSTLSLKKTIHDMVTTFRFLK
ncbi:MAG: hypothetical protein A3A33_00145 [Candidatus Yanofskybacteria bacterium RIFCSPLOWO2_01_FULL_49_25]|uniref:PsbP C-terminal domain-containing protein n=1 Tax=Candidatus Yanofskybacteria bacterium RIFCSPLOWO2_01_FULL_49_25 TaxID=1802701 RepID=A0A1F8GUG7_9BACT|nr:MAG: hypothetical protein A3A33_00145 [Candidatus Yanofskybacteria bacterium RIFCSPLOWO2_01_FULL_49_25]